MRARLGRKLMRSARLYLLSGGDLTGFRSTMLDTVKRISRPRSFNIPSHIPTLKEQSSLLPSVSRRYHRVRPTRTCKVVDRTYVGHTRTGVRIDLGGSTLQYARGVSRQDDLGPIEGRDRELLQSL